MSPLFKKSNIDNNKFNKFKDKTMILQNTIKSNNFLENTFGTHFPPLKNTRDWHFFKPQKNRHTDTYTTTAPTQHEQSTNLNEIIELLNEAELNDFFNDKQTLDKILNDNSVKPNTINYNEITEPTTDPQNNSVNYGGRPPIPYNEYLDGNKRIINFEDDFNIYEKHGFPNLCVKYQTDIDPTTQKIALTAKIRPLYRPKEADYEDFALHSRFRKLGNYYESEEFKDYELKRREKTRRANENAKLEIELQKEQRKITQRYENLQNELSENLTEQQKLNNKKIEYIHDKENEFMYDEINDRIDFFKQEEEKIREQLEEIKNPSPDYRTDEEFLKTIKIPQTKTKSGKPQNEQTSKENLQRTIRSIGKTFEKYDNFHKFSAFLTLTINKKDGLNSKIINEVQQKILDMIKYNDEEATSIIVFNQQSQNTAHYHILTNKKNIFEKEFIDEYQATLLSFNAQGTCVINQHQRNKESLENFSKNYRNYLLKNITEKHEDYRLFLEYKDKKKTIETDTNIDKNEKLKKIQELQNDEEYKRILFLNNKEAQQYKKGKQNYYYDGELDKRRVRKFTDEAALISSKWQTALLEVARKIHETTLLKYSILHKFCEVENIDINKIHIQPTNKIYIDNPKINLKDKQSLFEINIYTTYDYIIDE